MAYYKFEKEDVFHNALKTHPKNEFYIFPVSGSAGVFRVIRNGNLTASGSFSDNVLGTTPGGVSLYEINIDKAEGKNGYIYPFLSKESGQHGLKTVSSTGYSNALYGDVLSGSYNLSSSLHRQVWIASENGATARMRVSALANTLNYYSKLSPHYAMTSNTGGLVWSKLEQPMNLISIPSICFGEGIEKGTVSLQYYVTGTLVGELKDEKRNGELVQVGPIGSTGSGSVAGVVLYNEGFLVLTGSWVLNSEPKDYIASGSDQLRQSSWLYYGSGIPGKTVGHLTGSHYAMNFKGTNTVPTLTMMTYAKKAEVNNSNNPTFLASTGSHRTTISTGSYAVVEDPDRNIHNSVNTKYIGTTGSFEKQTFISKIKIYDENMNCIGEAKLARPVKKTEERDLMFKLKLDF